MVQYFKGGPSRSALQSQILGESLGSGVGNLIGDYFANKSLENVLGDKKLQEAPLSERYSALERALSPHGNRGATLLQRRLGIEQQAQQEVDQSIISKAMKGEPLDEKLLKRGSPETQFKIMQNRKNIEASGKLKNALVNRNVPEDVAENIAELYGSATEGGKTEILKNVLDMEKRGLLGNQPQEQPEESIDEKYPPLPKEEGLTPKERVDLKSSYRKENFPIFNETQNKIKAIKTADQSASILEQLNEKGTLPEGLDKWNVDWQTGEARFPALLGPDGERFVKTVNDFTTKAKDSYGGRVTNFELDRFMKRLPTLANSKEGRSIILKQMKLMNKLDSAYEKELKNVFQHYGIGNIAYEDAVRIAEKNVAQEEAGIIEELNGLVDQGNEQDMATQSQVPEGNVKVRVNGQEGSMPREQYERALKAGRKEYELVQ